MMHLYKYKIILYLLFAMVLILVVMDDALVLVPLSVFFVMKTWVLILVVMDDALVPEAELTPEEKAAVLILVVMDEITKIGRASCRERV